MSLLQSQFFLLDSSLIEDTSHREDIDARLTSSIDDRRLVLVQELHEKIERLWLLVGDLRNADGVADIFNDLLENLTSKIFKARTDLIFLVQDQNCKFERFVTSEQDVNRSLSLKNLHSVVDNLKFMVFEARTVASKCLVESNVAKDILKLFSLIRHLDDCREAVDVFCLCHIEK